MTQSKLSTVITFGIATLLIAGCSDNKSTTGVSLSKEATACYSEYVDLHDDIRKAFDDQAATGTASKAEFGKKHYEALGGEAGRALPEECADLLKFSMNCYDRYVDTYPDLIQAWQASGQPKSVWGKTHYENHGKLAGRDFPGGGGCSYEYVPSTRYILRFTDTVNNPCNKGCPSGVTVGDSFTIDVVVDNGASKISNTWNYEHAESITFRAGTWSATVNPRLGTGKAAYGSFKTNASGGLTDAPGITTVKNAGWGQGSSQIGPGQKDSNGKVISFYYLDGDNDIIFVFENGSSGAEDSVGSVDVGINNITKWSIR